MKRYLVGGAVRDSLLGFPFTERDWVVVGATAQDMLDAGFTQVGRDFPVFLHPQTKEEHALARTERKQGHGYTGFVVHADPDVTLEEDLRRRDLTINAIARDETGRLVDPYHGGEDIERRILRHVSVAFTEDPLRVLRVARFAARYAHLGFTVAAETLDLMREIAAQGELAHLPAERVWLEMDRALSERRPDVFIEVLRACDALAALLPEVAALFGVPQKAQHHPEVDTGAHLLLVLRRAAELTWQPGDAAPAAGRRLGMAARDDAGADAVSTDAPAPSTVTPDETGFDRAGPDQADSDHAHPEQADAEASSSGPQAGRGTRAQANSRVVFAALTHDLGKGVTPEDVLPGHRGHEQAGLPLVKSLCERLKVPNACRDLALIVCEHHLNCHRAFELRPATVLGLLERTGALRDATRFEEFLLACEADARGRAGFENNPYPQAAYWREARRLALAVTAGDVIAPGIEGPAIGDAMRRERIRRLTTLKKERAG